MSRVVHFEIQADDLERAKAFYGSVFRWIFEDNTFGVHQPDPEAA